MRRWTIPVALVAGGAALAAAALALAVGPDDSGVVGAQVRPDAVATTTAVAPPAPATPTPTRPAPTDPTPRTVSVDAVGTATGRPDTATVQFGVQVERSSAKQALGDAGAAAEQLLAALRGGGVKDEDLTTTDLSLYPRTGDDGTRLIGYGAGTSVRAELHDLAKAGALIDATAAAAGDAARINGVSFSIADTDALAARARVQAVRKGSDQAKGLAEAAGLHLGPLLHLSTAADDPVPLPAAYARDAKAAGTEAPSVPLQPGTQDVTARVTLVFELTS